MKFKQAFKDIKKPADIEQDKLTKYLVGLYNNPDFESENDTYVDDSKPESVAAYKERVTLLIDKLVMLSGNDKFNDLKANFDKEVSPGETRITLDEVRKTVEIMCYKFEHEPATNSEKVKVEIKNATLNACEAGALTNMQKILYSMDESYYAQKYDYIQNLANEYMRDNKLSIYDGNEVHVANDLIHEVRESYNVIPPRDMYAKYRDLSTEPEDGFATHAKFKEYVEQHFASREGIYSFANNLANGYITNLPDPLPNKKFLTKEDGTTNDSTELEQITMLAENLNISPTSIIDYSEDGKEFSYKKDYVSVIKAATMQDLARQGFIEQAPLTMNRTESLRIYAPPKVVRENGKAKMVRDTEGTVKTVIIRQQIIESPDGWYLAEEAGDKFSPCKKLLDTSKLKDLTIDGQNIEDYLHEQLKPSLESGKGFEDALRIVIDKNEHRVKMDSPDITKELFLLSDQGKKFVLLLSQEELNSMSIKDMHDWGDKNLENVLYKSLEKKDHALVKKLINLGVDINIKDNSGSTALHTAAKQGNTEVIAQLISLGVDINIKDGSSSTALHVAAKQGHSDVIAQLMREGVDVNIKDKSGSVALYDANLGCVHAVYEINKVKFKAELDQLRKEKDTATGSTKLSELEKKIEEREKYLEQIHYHKLKEFLSPDISKEDRAELKEQLFNKEAQAKFKDMNDKLISGLLKEHEETEGYVLVHEAVENSDIELLNILFDAGVSPDSQNAEGESAIHFARDTETIQHLIDAGANIDAHDKDDSTLLSYIKDIDAINLLLKNRADPNAIDKKGNAPLHNPRNVQIVEALIKYKADPNIVNKNGNTPLHNSRNIQVVEALLEAGADPNIQNKHGSTSLHHAETVEVARALLKAGADPNIVNSQGESPLHKACYHSDPLVMRSLLEYGADPNITTTSFGETPLHLAISMDNKELVDILLKAGANPNILDKKGVSLKNKKSEYFNDDAIIKLFKESIDSNDTKAMNNLLKHHPESVEFVVWEKKETLLSYAIAQKKPEVAAQMIEAGFKVNSFLGGIRKMFGAKQTPENVAKAIGGDVLKAYNKLQDAKKTSVDKEVVVKAKDISEAAKLAAKGVIVKLKDSHVKQEGPSRAKKASLQEEMERLKAHDMKQHSGARDAAIPMVADHDDDPMKGH